MSENKKDKVQVKITLEGPIKDFLEKEADVQCRKITAHVRYILNNYYAERMRTMGSQKVDMINIFDTQSDCYEPMVYNMNYNEPIVRAMNHSELKSTPMNNIVTESDRIVQQSDKEQLQKDALEEENLDYIDQDALDF